MEKTKEQSVQSISKDSVETYSWGLDLIRVIAMFFVVLGTLRFRESWYIWLLNNCVDLSIWTINVIRSTPNAEMSLVTAIMYLVMNVIGLVSWIKTEHRQKQSK